MDGEVCSTTLQLRSEDCRDGEYCLTRLSVPATDPSVSANLMKASATPMRIFTPESLAVLQRQNQGTIDRLVQGLDDQAHFLAYAAPTFIGFRQNAYLQLSFRTVLQGPPGISRYKLAALAF